MNTQTFEKLFKQLYEAIARYAGQPLPMDMEECRQCCPIKTEQVQGWEKRSDYYR